MQKLENRIKRIFTYALGYTICLPFGIGFLAWGIVDSIWALVGFACIIIFVGVFIVPFLWLHYLDLLQCKTIISIIETENVASIDDICKTTGFSIEKTKKLVSFINKKKYVENKVAI